MTARKRNSACPRCGETNRSQFSKHGIYCLACTKQRYQERRVTFLEKQRARRAAETARRQAERAATGAKPKREQFHMSDTVPPPPSTRPICAAMNGDIAGAEAARAVGVVIKEQEQ